MGELIWRRSERSTNNGGACVEVAVSDNGERD
ncbi:DUF397 domain-containing protein [Actinoallomurus bryophytorum]|nr:DUF397 domain-containing protein [Actinoallomurus bryophytorum]